MCKEIKLNPDYAIEITYLAQIIAIWAFTKNHQLTFGLISIFLQVPKRQALAQYFVFLLHNFGLKFKENGIAAWCYSHQSGNLVGFILVG